MFFCFLLYHFMLETANFIGIEVELNKVKMHFNIKKWCDGYINITKNYLITASSFILQSIIHSILNKQKQKGFHLQIVGIYSVEVLFGVVVISLM